MSRHALSVISMVVLSGLSAAWSDAAGATVSDTYSAATQAGLVSVQSRYLDEVYLEPAADWVGYRKVLIDPVQVALRPELAQRSERKPGPVAPDLRDRRGGNRAAGDRRHGQDGRRRVRRQGV